MPRRARIPHTLRAIPQTGQILDVGPLVAYKLHGSYFRRAPLSCKTSEEEEEDYGGKEKGDQESVGEGQETEQKTDFGPQSGRARRVRHFGELANETGDMKGQAGMLREISETSSRSAFRA
jgi:hypothetical protein